MANPKQSKAVGLIDVHAALFIAKYVRKDLPQPEIDIVLLYFMELCDTELRTDALEEILAFSREHPVLIKG